MKVRFSSSLLHFLLFFAVSAYAEENYYLPHVANGQTSGGSIRTSFVLINTNSNEVTAHIIVTGDDGSPMQLTLGELGHDSSFSVNLARGETRILQTDGNGSAIAGAARVTANTLIGVSAILSMFDPAGNFLTEASINSTPILDAFVLPVESTEGITTGVALFNPGCSGPYCNESLDLYLVDTLGQEVARTSISLQSGRHLAKPVTGPDGLFPLVGNFRGTLQSYTRIFSCYDFAVPVAAVALRQNFALFSFTTLPVAPMRCVNCWGPTQQIEFELAQVANGSFPGGSIRTSFLIFRTESTQLNAFAPSHATVNVSLTKDDGAPLAATIPGIDTPSEFALNIEPGESVFLTTDGKGKLEGGAARLKSNVPVGVRATIGIYDSQGRIVAETGVADAPPRKEFTLPVDVTNGLDTGVAFLNTKPVAVSLTLRLMDLTGRLVAAPITRNLGGGNHLAKLVSELFAEAKNFRGSLSVSASSPVSALTLRQNPSPLTFTESPLAAGSFGSGIAPAPMSSLKIAGVNATTDVKSDVTLPPESSRISLFSLTGIVTGLNWVPGYPFQTVRAQKIGGTEYKGVVNVQTGQYSMFLPPGVYTLSVQQFLSLRGTSLNLNYDEPVPVEVSTDTTRDISIPALTTSEVSGKVVGVYVPRGCSGCAQIRFSSDDQKGLAVSSIDFDGSYQAQLPDGTYSVSLKGDVAFSPQDFGSSETALVMLDLGKVTVAGPAVSRHFVLPPSTMLTGTVRTPTGCGSASVWDTSFPQSIIYLRVNRDTCAYEIMLTRNLTYKVSQFLGFNFYYEGLGYPGLTLAPAVAIAADTVLDLDIPSLPPWVIISGRVTDNTGRGIVASVSARTVSLIGIPGSLDASASTDLTGYYRLKVLSGTDYELSFKPEPGLQ